MKTMFSNSPFQQSFFAMPARPLPLGMAPRLGQADFHTLAPDVRTKVLTKIGGALKLVPVLDEVVALSADMPLYQSFMQADAMPYLQLSNEAAALYPTVKTVNDRLSRESAEEWYASDAELAAVDAWLQKINAMYKIFLVHFPKTTGPTTAMMPIPLTAQPGTVPAPRTETAPAAASPGPAPAPMVLGMDANKVILGVGVAAALGILIYAIS